MFWEQYLQTVQNNDPWQIAYRWAYFADKAVSDMDINIERTREYRTVAVDLMEAVDEKNAEMVDWLSEVMEPKTDFSDSSFFNDQYIFEHDPISAKAHNMALTGFSSCLAILSAWNFTHNKSQLWESNKQMSVYPEVINDIESNGYMGAFRQFVLDDIKDQKSSRDGKVPQSKGELSEVTQTIWTYAPDSYDELYWPTPVRPTLDSDFEELRRGINYVFRQKRFNESRPALLELVEAAYSAYKSGDREQGMELISQVQIAYGKMK